MKRSFRIFGYTVELGFERSVAAQPIAAALEAERRHVPTALDTQIADSQSLARIHGDVDVATEAEPITPLVDQFRDLIREDHWGRIRYFNGFKPARFLLARFNLNWRIESLYLLQLDVMPSSIVRSLAIEMAHGDLELAQRIANSRSTKGLRTAEYTLRQAGVSGCLITGLWRFNGNPDVLWYALRDEMLRCRAAADARIAELQKQLSGGAA